MIRIYSIQDLADWLVEGKNNGLSEMVISKPRAWAFVNNPCASPTTPAVAVLFEDDETKGYAAVFPERFEGVEPTIYWGSTYFVDESMRGKGCGVKILSELQNSLDGVYATTQTPVSSSAIFKKLGAQETWFPEYWIKLQKWNPNRGKRSLLKQCGNQLYASAVQHSKRIEKWCHSFRFRLEYCSFIDEETYAFIKDNKCNDLMLRSREMLNWMLAYPFLVNAVLPHRIQSPNNYFSCYKQDFEQYAVKVLDESNRLVGFYIFKYDAGEVNLLYLYYLPESENVVMASFFEHLMKMGSVRLRTTSGELVLFIKRNALPVLGIASSRLNFCAPATIGVPQGATIQGGDGDMFVI